MTTNHPANGPVSLDRLHQIREILSKASAQSDGGNLGYAMADAVKVIDGAIAEFGAEPVAWRYRYVHTPKTEEHGSPFTTEWKLCDREDECNPSDCFERQPLYTAPPAPVVPDELLSAMEEVLRISDRDHEAWHKARNGIASCRAAMLQAGNYPVTPDGLVSCGENCWSCGKYFTYEQHSECDGYCPHCDSPVDLDDEEDEQSKSLPANPTEEMISNAWREALGKCDHETIRRMYVAMFAAAPQQEVK
ncbi:hypothetical protein [Citrobacter freundii]|uniref:hypothetical protein n=1 Tax=Citrobacter freundii TaxID=546 RepID=UPI0019050CF3|nr:hypothetical protein [Citrobacter freundii]MBJ9035576.1 hypothetical protein [Citrobacter freundii]